jgi:divalent metal cation (Fe/Co/Zn/Cd) transporter
VLDILGERPGDCSPHDLTVRNEDGMVSIVLHCTMEGDSPISEAHAASADIETLLRRRIPNVGQVVIHLEPAGAHG